MDGAPRESLAYDVFESHRAIDPDTIDLMVFRVRGWQELADGEPDPRA